MFVSADGNRNTFCKGDVPKLTAYSSLRVVFHGKRKGSSAECSVTCADYLATTTTSTTNTTTTKTANTTTTATTTTNPPLLPAIKGLKIHKIQMK